MKVIVAHPAQQHSYRLAAALKRCGKLYRYATTVYYKRYSLTKLVALFLKGNFRVKAQGRVCSELNDDEVIQFCEAEGLLKLLALNTPLLKKHYNKIKYHTADRFAKKVARYAIRHRADAVVTYDNTSPVLFEILKEKAPHIVRIADVSAANPLYMKNIYEKDLALAPSFAERLRNERRLVWDEAIQQRTKREIELTQHFLVPSAFVAQTYGAFGVLPQQIHICPYGVDTALFLPKEHYETNDSRPLHCIYVGGVKELKGISYLLQAFHRIPKNVATLTVVGRADTGNEDIVPYAQDAVFTGTVLHQDIPALLRQADVFILPSLGEGLSLSVLEAAACGLPLIVSENAGVTKKMTDGKEGFIIPIQSAAAIEEKVLWYAANRNQLEPMGKAAAAFAQKYTWDVYNERIKDIFEQLLENDGE